MIVNMPDEMFSVLFVPFAKYKEEILKEREYKELILNKQ